MRSFQERRKPPPPKTRRNRENKDFWDGAVINE
jgi:hypothetical protein